MASLSLRRLAFSIIRPAVVGVIVVSAACQEQAAIPTVRDDSRAQSAISPSQVEFFYYRGSPIELDVDPTRIMVASADSQNAMNAVRRRGFAVERSIRLLPNRNYWLLNVPVADSPTSRALVTQLRTDPALSFATSVYKTVEGGYDVILVDRVAVRFKDDVPVARIDSLVRSLGLGLARPPRPDSGFTYYVFSYPPDSASPLRVAAFLDRHPLVEWADPDRITKKWKDGIPPDPYYSFQFHLKNSITRNGVRVDDNVEQAWDLTTGAVSAAAGGNRVGVIGDGVEAAHPDFGIGQVIDGYDALSCYPGCIDSETHPLWSDRHETAAAGIIGAQHNTIGVSGIAPGVIIIPGRVFRGPDAATDLGFADAINFLWYSKGAWLISNSWSANVPSNLIENAIRDGNIRGRGGKGTVFVFSTGNFSDRRNNIIVPPRWPGRMAEVVGVSAIDRNGAITNYSPEGLEIDIVAPSSHDVGSPGQLCVGEVVTLDRSGQYGCNDGPTGDIDYTMSFAGTSAAAPQVAGVAALTLARNPTFTSSALKSRLYESADPWGAATQFGAGKVNAFRSVQNVFVSITGATTIKKPAAYTWTASASGGTGTYTFRWEESINGGAFVDVGSGSSYNKYVDASTGQYFDLRVTATSGIESGASTERVNIVIPP